MPFWPVFDLFWPFVCMIWLNSFYITDQRCFWDISTGYCWHRPITVREIGWNGQKKTFLTSFWPFFDLFVHRPVVRSERAYGPWFRRLRRRNIYTVDAGTRAFGPSIILNGHTARNFVTFFDLFYVCFGKQKRHSWWTVLRPVISSPSATKSPKNNLKLAKT